MGNNENPILSSGTLPKVPFEERAGAAAAAGFKGISLFVEDYIEERQRLSVEDFVEILDRHGVRLEEIEVAIGFDHGPVSGEPITADEPWQAEVAPGMNRVNAATERAIFEMADAFAPHHVLAVGSYGPELDEKVAIARLAALADRCADHDLIVALEFVPGTSVPDAGVATHLVTAADRPNLGICIDAIHHFRGAADEELLRAIPREKVASVHLTDGPEEPTRPVYFEETVTDRRLPGEGDWDLASFLSIFEDAEAPISVEVLSTELQEVGAHEVAARTAAACAPLLGNPR